MKNDANNTHPTRNGSDKKGFSWSLPQGANSHAIDPCNVRGKTAKVIKHDETRATRTAVVDAETQNTVALLRRELQEKKMRVFEDLTRQRAKIVTVVEGGNGSSSSSVGGAHELDKHSRPRKHALRSAAAQPVAVAAASRATVEAALMPETEPKNVFEVALEKVDLNFAILRERLRMS